MTARGPANLVTLRRAALATAMAAALGGCAGAPEMPAPAPPEVVLDTPERREVTLFAEFTGTTKSVSAVEIRARVTGELEEMTFSPSQIVAPDDQLFVIEPRPYAAALDEAKAAVAAAQADLDRTESDLDRLEFAVKTNAVSQSDVDLARAQRDMAIATLQSTKANLDAAELQFSYTTVRSPIAGQVGRNLVDVGNIVSGSERTVLATVRQIQPIHVYFDAPERVVLESLGRVTAVTTEALEGKDPAEVRREAQHPAYFATLKDRDFPLRGYIDFVDNTVNPDTGTIQIRALYENDDLDLFPGLFVRVRVPTDTLPDAILVDERAIGTDLGGKYVFVVDAENIVEQRYVELGPVQQDGMIPVFEGLEADEQYIREGILRARPGMPVQPSQATGS